MRGTMMALLLVEDNVNLRPAMAAGLEATGAVRVALMDVQLAGALNGMQAAAPRPIFVPRTSHGLPMTAHRRQV